MEQEYHPLLDTLRLYAGWLLACLSVIYVFGSYQELRHLPFDIPIAREWVESSLILHVTATTFLFLMLSSIHQAVRRGTWKGIALAIFGFLLLIVFRVNT